MTDLPARIWLDLTQVCIGYTSDPTDVREGDTAFVRADLVTPGNTIDLAKLKAELVEEWQMLTEAAELLETIGTPQAHTLAARLRELAGEAVTDEGAGND